MNFKENTWTHRIEATCRTAFPFGATAALAGCLAAAAVNAQTARTTQPYDDIVRGLVSQNLSLDPARALDSKRSTAIPEVQGAQNAILQYSKNATQLISALYIEEQYSPSVRPLIGDALHVKADADVLAQRASYMTSMRQFTKEYASIDRQWRVLANQLKQTPNVSQRVIKEVDRMNEAAAVIEESTNLAPQMQKAELAAHFFSLSADLRYLAEDVRRELWNNSQRETITLQIWELQNQTSQLSAAIQSNHRYDYVNENYAAFFQQWIVMKRTLRTIPSTSLQRSIDRVTETNDRIHELLWLPSYVDGGDILYMANSLKQNIDSICNDVTLTSMLELPNGNAIFGAAKEFYSLSGTFRTAVENSQSYDEVQWEFRELDVAWHDLRNLLLPLNEAKTTERVSLIDESIMRLRGSLGEQSTIDTRDVVAVASTIDNMSDLLFYDLDRYVGQSNRYPASFRSRAVNSAKALHDSSHALYAAVIQNHGAATLREHSQTLVVRWNDLQQYLAKIPPDDRELVTRTSQQLAPAIAKLQVMYY